MRVPRKYIDSFTASVNFLSADMRTRLGDALALVDMSDISSARDAVIDIMQLFLGSYTDMAAMLGAEFYDGLREMALGSAIGAVAESGWEPEAEDAAVRAMIQGVVDGGSAADFIAQLIDRADSEVRRSANESVARNARRDKAKVGYARVPSGVETCKWCIAIAANGPSFKSMEIASHSHPNCDCRVVPDFGDGIQGYDPDYYYDVYKHPENHPEYREARNERRRKLYRINNERTTEATRKKPSDTELRRSSIKPVDEQLYGSSKARIERNGGTVIRGGADANRHLDAVGADAACIGGTVIFRDIPTTSEVLEETFHFFQELNGDYSDRDFRAASLLREIDAQEYLLTMTERFKIPEEEVSQTIANLEYYRNELECIMGGGV